MNDRDKNNLQFILSLDEEGFEDWYVTLDQDDMDYAMELLQQARTEVALQIASLHDDIEDVSDAKSVLKQFTLKGN
jgi:hypothetical protein